MISRDISLDIDPEVIEPTSSAIGDRLILTAHVIRESRRRIREGLPAAFDAAADQCGQAAARVQVAVEELVGSAHTHCQMAAARVANAVTSIVDRAMSHICEAHAAVAKVERRNAKTEARRQAKLQPPPAVPLTAQPPPPQTVAPRPPLSERIRQLPREPIMELSAPFGPPPLADQIAGLWISQQGSADGLYLTDFPLTAWDRLNSSGWWLSIQPTPLTRAEIGVFLNTDNGVVSAGSVSLNIGYDMDSDQLAGFLEAMMLPLDSVVIWSQEEAYRESVIRYGSGITDAVWRDYGLTIPDLPEPRDMAAVQASGTGAALPSDADAGIVGQTVPVALPDALAIAPAVAPQPGQQLPGGLQVPGMPGVGNLLGQQLPPGMAAQLQQLQQLAPGDLIARLWESGLRPLAERVARWYGIDLTGVPGLAGIDQLQAYWARRNGA